MDEGRYSYDAVELELIDVGARNLVGSALRVLAAALARMAARWGALERSAVLASLQVIFQSEFDGIQVSEKTDGAESLVLMPYLARVEYSV